MLGMDIGLALGGAIFTETVFQLPGLGQTAIIGDQQPRPADRAGRDRLRDGRDHRLQPDRRPVVRLDRPANPADLSDQPVALLDVKDLRRPSAPTTASSRPSTASSFSVEKGQTLGIVGESGSGKSVTCLTIMGLNPKRNTISSGEALWKGEDLLTMKPSELRQIRGNEISMIFQDPMTSLNPVHTIGRQLDRGDPAPPRRDEEAGARARALELLKAVGIPRAEQPHRRLPAPVLGRHAPARDDRDGADQRPRPADRRRADDRARRDDAGADPRR